MKSAHTYRQNAADCMKLAGEANDAFAKAALAELAAEFSKAADAIEHERDQNGTIKHRRAS
jgi:hypothetical protein